MKKGTTDTMATRKGGMTASLSTQLNREWRFTANVTKLVPQKGKKQTQFK